MHSLDKYKYYAFYKKNEYKNNTLNLVIIKMQSQYQPQPSQPSQPQPGTDVIDPDNSVPEDKRYNPATAKSDKFKLLCSCIRLIERRYDGKRSRLNLKGFCDRINLRRGKYNEMVEKAPVEIILYLMGVLVKLIEDIENGRNKSFYRDEDKKSSKSSNERYEERDEDATTDEEKEKILNMVMDRMIQEEREERQRQQQLMQAQMQAQVQYATQMASAYLPGFFQGGNAPNVVIPGVGSYPMGSMYGSGIGMNGGGGYGGMMGSTPYNPYTSRQDAAPQPLPKGPSYYTQSQSQSQSQPQPQPQPHSHSHSHSHSQPQYSQQPQHPQFQQFGPNNNSRYPFNYEHDNDLGGFDIANDFPEMMFGGQQQYHTPQSSQPQPQPQPQPQQQPQQKRGRGRPKGAKNKPKDENSPVKEKKGRGRPKGSKNKPK